MSATAVLIVVLGSGGVSMTVRAIAVQIRLNAESKRKYALARHVFDQTRHPTVLLEIAELTRAERPARTLVWRPNDAGGPKPSDDSPP